MTEPRLSLQSIRVLRQFLRGGPQFGYGIKAATGIQTGTLFPILRKLEAAKWLSAKWEAGTPAKLGRPRRRIYSLTSLGARKAAAAMLGLR